MARTGAEKVGLVPTLTEHGSYLFQFDHRYTRELTGPEDMSFWLAWRVRSAMIMSLFGGNTGSGRDFGPARGGVWKPAHARRCATQR